MQGWLAYKLSMALDTELGIQTQLSMLRKSGKYFNNRVMFPTLILVDVYTFVLYIWDSDI